MAPIDPVELACALVRCPSVTPEEGGAQSLLAETLEPLGFAVERLRFAGEGRPAIDNLFARLGKDGPHLAFNGHTDVVPPGDREAWSVDPFAAEIQDGWLIGRGAADMKGNIACFIAAIARYLERHGPPKGSISLLITGDEEGPALDGTVELLRWAEDQGHEFDAGIVGEPTSVETLGDMAKIGRRGSLTATIEAFGKQGHVGYAHLADNAAHRLTALLQRLIEARLDAGTDHFEPSSLQVTTIDIDNPASNVIPAKARAVLNIRYNDSQTPESLKAHVEAAAAAVGGRFDIAYSEGAAVFVCPSGPLAELMTASIAAVAGLKPKLSTSGGTSDARFVQHYCPVIEFGLIGATIHQIDERVEIADLERLTLIYLDFLERYFEA